MPRKNLKLVMQGALLLSVASLIAKVLSAIYRVPFQNMVGDTGFYVYQQIYPIYGIGMTVALSGLPMFISKLVAETQDLTTRRAMLSRILILIGIFSLVVFGGLQLWALKIASAMGDPALAPIIRAVSWMYLFSPFLAVSRGYFQGEYDMKPTAVSQLVEQTVRVAVILLVAYWAMRHGWDVYRMGTWAMSSAAIAALFATIVLSYFIQQKRLKLVRMDVRTIGPGYEELAKRLLIEGGTISLFASMMVLLQLVDSFTVMRGLVIHGYPDVVSKALKGVYDRGQPLVQLGLVIATSFSSSLLPSLTEALKQGRRGQFARQAVTVIRMGLVISVAATAGLITLMPKIDTILFGNQEGVTTLCVYVLSIVFATLIMIYNSILQSTNQFSVTIAGLGMGLLVKILINQRMVIGFGLVGASWATVISLLVMTTFLTAQLRRERLAAISQRFLTKLIGISIAMMLGVQILLVIANWLLVLTNPASRWQALIQTAIGVAGGGVLFIWLSLRYQLLTVREWLTLPKADKWLRWFKK